MRKRYFAALAAGHFAPDVVERALRRLIRRVHVGGAGERDLGELLLVAGIDGVEIFSALRRDELAVDEQIVARLELRVRRLGRGIVFPKIAEDQLGRGPAVAAGDRADAFFSEARVGMDGIYLTTDSTDEHRSNSSANLHLSVPICAICG